MLGTQNLVSCSLSVIIILLCSYTAQRFEVCLCVLLCYRLSAELPWYVGWYIECPPRKESRVSLVLESRVSWVRILPRAALLPQKEGAVLGVIDLIALPCLSTSLPSIIVDTSIADGYGSFLFFLPLSFNLNMLCAYNPTLSFLVNPRRIII